MTPQRILDTILGLLITVCLALSGWSLKSIIDIDKRVVSLEATAFTNQDGLEVWREISNIRQQIATLPKSQQPPDWFVKRVDKMEASFEERFNKIENKIDKLNQKQ